MPLEIERRWIVRQVTYPPVQPVDIEQGYFGQGLRVRVTRSRTEPPAACLTYKTGRGMVREERSWDVPVEAAELLLAATPLRVTKQRYVHDGFELDVFAGNLTGLVLLECEHPDAAEVSAALPPAWVQDCTEVTDVLTNRQLSFMAATLGGWRSDVALRPEVPRIVLTGAPCSGKSTALRQLRAEHPELHCVGETATILMDQVAVTPPDGPVFQRTLLAVQHAFEDAAAATAKASARRAVVCDRGTLDVAAFMGGVPTYEAALGRAHRDDYARYNTVVLLRLPSRDIYDANKANNPVRRETYDQALAVEAALVAVWSAHPGYCEIQADWPSWEAKYAAIRDLVLRVSE